MPEIVIEEQLEGNVYRLLFLDGKLLDAVVRYPPMVTGDGESTICQLIRRENQARSAPGARRAQNLLRINLDTNNTLAAQGLSLPSTPKALQHVKVKDVINENRIEENEYPPEGVASFFGQIGETIYQNVGVKLVGVDVIAPTLSQGLAGSGGRVIELNAPPGHFSHHLRRGEGFHVGLRLLQELLG